MTLTAQTLPPTIARALPPAARLVFAAAVNSARASGADEDRAMVTAWAAVRRAGYTRGDDGVWVKAVEKVHMDTLYVSRRLMNASALMRWAREQKIPGQLAESDSLHVTVAYSRALVDWDGIGDSYSPEVTVEGGPRYITMLGAPATTLVLAFTSGHLRWRHEEFKEAGAVWDWPTYKPHVSIAYDLPEGFDLAGIKPYLGPLRFGPEIFSPVNENWRDTLAKAKYGVWWSNRNTPTVVEAESGSEARTKANAKKKDGYGSIVSVRRLTGASLTQANRGDWVRERASGAAPGRTNAPSRYRPQLGNG
jgi:cation transport regulator ChaB